MTYLFRASFSPVQSFISQARKLQDLYAGSFVLSHLARVMIETAQKLGAEILYPKIESGRESYPNLFMAKFACETPDELKAFAAKINASVTDEWRGIANRVMSAWQLTANTEFDAQIDNLWQLFWAAAEYKDDADYRAAFLETIQRMGAAKAARTFAQPAQGAGRKCDLATEYNALFCRKIKGHMNPAFTYELEKIDEKYIKDGEALSGVSFVKRSLKKAVESFNDSFSDITSIAHLTNPKCDYYALVMFDGDNMGSLYSSKDIENENLEEFQQALSEVVSKSAQSTREIVNVKSKNGVVIYAGGDDFLGVLNLENVFETLKTLRKNFQSTIKIDKYLKDYKATFSAGIVIAHAEAPLAEVLRWARKSESNAKKHNNGKKDAYCLTILKHSGEITQYCHGFSVDCTDGMSVLQNLINLCAEDGVSVGFIYQLAQEFKRVKSANWKEMFECETKRLLERSQTPKDAGNKICEILDTLRTGSDSQEDFVSLLLATAFIARQRGGAK